MTLREVLDEVRFGNVGRLCIAVCGKNDFLKHFKKGQYWELECGNWHDGSCSQTTPEMPEEFLDAEVTQIECATNVADIYFNLGKLRNDNWNYTVVLVEEPDGYDAKKYWTKENMNEPVKDINWPYNISKELWYEVQKAVPNTICRMLALSNLFHIGINTAAEMTDEQIDETKGSDNAVLGFPQDEILRAVRAIAQTVKDCDMNAIMALYQLAGMGSAFNKEL